MPDWGSDAFFGKQTTDRAVVSPCLYNTIDDVVTRRRGEAFEGRGVCGMANSGIFPYHKSLAQSLLAGVFVWDIDTHTGETRIDHGCFLAVWVPR